MSQRILQITGLTDPVDEDGIALADPNLATDELRPSPFNYSITASQDYLALTETSLATSSVH